ncbi:unnamed protein product, partial [Ceratitis capitata]
YGRPHTRTGICYEHNQKQEQSTGEVGGGWRRGEKNSELNRIHDSTRAETDADKLTEHWQRRCRSRCEVK